MLNLKLLSKPLNRVAIQAESHKRSSVEVNHKSSEVELETNLVERRKTALQVEEELRRIRERIYLIRPNVF
ncbi:hypothetical protein Nos7524_5125 [Nostoc sp. PCC 7524]|uniref:hypothetical protein n=1 Tax=Nostoc sp. (strain ATCC 29411 / PCC 7524) TaxID=28072 RepID=UPI00029F283C|nr:hypothetical protein [Nostoc sp. PCC 7524]AFY50849.1 hypothetical protein Nos7524_5125 [Nostoc sp. PCC 7524]